MNENMSGFEEMNNAPDFEEMDWDSEIEKDSSFTLLAEGDYDFVVETFERARHEGSEKIPPCKKAIVYLKIAGKDMETGCDGEALVRHQLLLHSKMEGMLCEFFLGIGLRKKGERLKMNWTQVPGCRGRAKIGIREYNGRKYNEVKKFYDPDNLPKAQPQRTSFTPGEF